MFFTVEDEWRSKAKCVGDDPRKWDVENLPFFGKEKAAEVLCAGCPVLQKCRVDAERVMWAEDFLPTSSWDEVSRPVRTSSVVRGGRIF